MCVVVCVVWCGELLVRRDVVMWERGDAWCVVVYVKCCLSCCVCVCVVKRVVVQ